VDYVIPSNDDASKSIDKILSLVTEAVIDGLANRNSDAPADEADAMEADAVEAAPVAAPAAEVAAPAVEEVAAPVAEVEATEEKTEE